jgi:hypothetical protein
VNDIAIPTRITDVCDARDSALVKIRKAYDLMISAKIELEDICSYAFPSREISPRLSFEDAVKQIDISLWRYCFDYTGLMQIMDAEAKKNFMRDVETDAPPFALEHIRMTFLQLMQDSETMFARGLVNVFLKLSRNYKTNTNEPFKVNKRAVLTGMVDPSYAGGLHIHYREWASSTLNDIDRVFLSLDGQKHIPRALENAISVAWKATRSGAFFENDYFRIKGYLNGNMHIEFKRLDLLEKANLIIHNYYKGSALARGNPTI